MEKIKIQDLSVIADKRLAEQKGYKSMLMVCAGTGCVAAGSISLYESFQCRTKSQGT
jgi:NADH:ubiquinone oxidoreductase subunit E